MTPARFSAMIVDDEYLARETIRLRLADDPDISQTHECEDGRTAIKQLESLRPDLLFLDIQMPGLTGLDVARKISLQPMPAIIFVTAYDKYAVNAFDLQALDYLLKPFSPERFTIALQRAKNRLRERTTMEIASRLPALLESLSGPSYLQRFTVRRDGRISFVPVDAVDWLQAAGNYVHVHCRNESYMVHATLQDLESRLDPRFFLRIHRSCIVNIQMIKEFHSIFRGEYMAVLEGGIRLRSGGAYRKNIEEFLQSGKV